MGVIEAEVNGEPVHSRQLEDALRASGLRDVGPRADQLSVQQAFAVAWRRVGLVPGQDDSGNLCYVPADFPTGGSLTDASHRVPAVRGHLKRLVEVAT